MKKISSVTALMFAMLLPAYSADTQTLWTTGKIHVVIGVLLIILVLIFVFLLVMERKISRLEKKI